MSAIDDLTVKLSRVRGHWRVTPGGKKIWVRTYTDKRNKATAALHEVMGVKPKAPDSGTESKSAAPTVKQATEAVQKVAKEAQKPAGDVQTPDRNRNATDPRGTHYGFAQGVLSKAAEFEPQLTSSLKQIVDNNDGSMAGLEFRLKTEDSLARKIRDKALSKKMPEEQYAKEIGDAVRYTALYDPDSYVEKAEATLKALETAGHKVIDVENNWARGDAYSGVNSVLEAPNGMRWELQFHTEDSLVAKERAHEFYDTVRDPSKPIAERKDAYSRSTAQWEDVAQPKDWESFGKQIFRPDPELFDQAAFNDEKVTAKKRLDDARQQRLKDAAKKKRDQMDSVRKAQGAPPAQNLIAASNT